jgi:hypothetical protein
MTAYRVIDDHGELANSGAVPHADLDNFVNNTAWVVVSGSAALPPSARKLVAGPGITITDNGPGGDLVIEVAAGYFPRFQWNEVPSGSIDGVNTAFTVSFPPVPTNSLLFFVNGVLQKQSPVSDYVLSGSTITVAKAPKKNDNLLALYQY